jgi:hypothetical protein
MGFLFIVIFDLFSSNMTTCMIILIQIFSSLFIFSVILVIEKLGNLVFLILLK